jgi:hypothetical protein
MIARWLPLLNDLVGDDVASVTFDQYGIALAFGEATFAAHVWPRVVIGARIWAFGDGGYRDAVCALSRTP